MTRTVKPSAINRPTVCTPINPAPPVTRTRVGALNDEAAVVARRRPRRGDGRLAVPRAAGGPTGGTRRDPVRSLSPAGAAGRTGGIRLRRGPSLAIPAPPGKRPATTGPHHPGGHAQQLG